MVKPLRPFLLFPLLIACAAAQTASYPSSVVTDNQLRVAVNSVQTTLTFPMLATDTTINVANATGIPVNAEITIDNEKIAVCGVSGNQLTVGKSSCPNVDGRDFDGTSASTHASGAGVYMNTDAWSHNANAKEIEAIEGFLGVNGVNIPGLIPNPLPINKGGTGQSTATAALGALLSGSTQGSGSKVQMAGANSGMTGAPLCNDSGGNTTTTGCTPALPTGSQTQVLQLQPNTGNNSTYQWASKPMLVTTDFAYSITPSSPASLTGGGGAQTITLPVCPLGLYLSGAPTGAQWAAVYISGGTGTGESVSPSGGTCSSATPGVSGGTIILSPANSHSGAWTIQSSTAGVQEAINYAISQSNAGPPQVYSPGGIYNFYGTLYVPPVKDLRIDSGNAIWIFPTTQTTDGIIIDSCEDCDYRLPLMIYYGSGNAVHLWPHNPDPASLTTFVDSRLWLTDVGQGGPSYYGVGNAILELDITNGDISHDDIFVGGAGGTKYGVLVTGSNASGVNQDQITLSDMNTCTVAEVKDNSFAQRNTWFIRGSGTNTAAGALIYGAHSEWHITTSGFAAGQGFVIESSAAHNAIFSSVLDAGFTNNATAGYNRIYLADYSSAAYNQSPLGFRVTTPTFPTSGVVVANTNATTVVIQFPTAGTSASFLVYDDQGNHQTTGSNIVQGQMVMLAPGEGIVINYSAAPTWQWRAVQ